MVIPSRSGEVCSGLAACTRYSTFPSAPRNGDSVQPEHATASADERITDLVTHTGVDVGIGDHTLALADFGTARFELRFHEEHHGTPRLAQADERGDDHFQRDEREVADDQIDATSDLIRRSRGGRCTVRDS